jgi:hypothetical protein
MTPTLHVAQITGPGVIHLSLHTRRDRAVARIAAEARDAYRRTFGYNLPERLDDDAVVERIEAEGWVVSIDEVEVDLP